VLTASAESGALETFTLVQGRAGPSHAIAFGRTDSGQRFIARSDDAEVMAVLSQEDFPIGRRLAISNSAEVSTFKFA